MNLLKSVAVVIALVCVLESCASIHAYSIVLTSAYDGKAVIENEKNVALFLEDVMRNDSVCVMQAFDRKAISHKVQKTGETTHSFYVLFMADNTFHTLSFSATSKWATSRGAWALNTETDLASYADYLDGGNIWEVREIVTRNGINTRLTLENVLAKIHGPTTYYYRAQINKNDAHDNCNSALMETLVENK